MDDVPQARETPTHTNSSAPSPGMFSSWNSHRLAAIHGVSPTPFMMNYHLAAMSPSKTPSQNGSPSVTLRDQGSRSSPEEFRLTEPAILKDHDSDRQLSDDPTKGSPVSDGSSAPPLAASQAAPPPPANRQFPVWQSPPQSAPGMESGTAFDAAAAQAPGPRARTLPPTPLPERRAGSLMAARGGQREWWEDILCLEPLGCCAARARPR